MMKKSIAILLGVLFALQLSAQSNVKQYLDNLFTKAEQNYLIGDYQQLGTCIDQYGKALDTYQDILGDSIDVYYAYYAKMISSYDYGLIGYDSADYYAEKNYIYSLNIFNNRHDVTNATVIHEELAQLYYKMKTYEKAKAQLDTVFSYYDERLNNMGVTSVTPEYYKTLTQLAMCNARLGDFQTALLQIDGALNEYYKKNKDNQYYETLRKRAKILMLQADYIGTTNVKDAIKCYQQYVDDFCSSVEKQMDGMTASQRNQYWLSMHQFLFDCYRLGNHAPEMLYNLVLFSKDYLVRKDAKTTNWQQVRQALGKNECAIEFVQYFGKNDEKRMGCLILKNNSKKPLFIDLFSTDSILNLPLTDSITIGEAIPDQDNYDMKDTLYNDNRLPTLIWTKSLMDAIGDAQKVYFSPDGMLHLLAIEYLMPDTTKTGYRLSSTRTLLRKRTAPNLASALLCGGIEYNALYLPEERGNDVVAYRHLASPYRSTTEYLPGTLYEVNSIYDQRKPFNRKDTLLIGKDATEEAFLNLVKQHFDIIHISTHGYYHGTIGIQNDIKPVFNEDFMSLSGLILAGSDNSLTDRNFDENMSDGVLSAAEFSLQDLTQTELIVLNACQTGLGRLTDDGVYGLQHGLIQAGVGAMIITLWPVGDYSSALLLSFFYEELENQGTKNIHSAFQNARKRSMQESATFVYEMDEDGTPIKYENVRFNKPQDANPFILIDAF